jgi:SAM-dependent methyltransferase
VSADALAGHCERLERENARLWAALFQMVFADEPATGEGPADPPADGLPVPPPVLRFLVAQTDDLEWFLSSGRLGAQTVTDCLARNGLALERCRRVLDWGCGCGRVLPPLGGVPRPEFHGADRNAKAVAWCRQNLGFARFAANALRPPLPYPDRHFDLVYVFSVFTHLTEPEQGRWMDEMRRVLVPGGHLLFSTHGDKAAEGLAPAERAEYQKGNGLVLGGHVLGTNFCAAYHPEGYVRRVLARGFEVVDFTPEGAKGNPPQDLYLVRAG